MSEITICPQCSSENIYFDGTMYICPDCNSEHSATKSDVVKDNIARDSNGVILEDGDAVTLIKDLKVRGSSMVVKRGTKVKSIRLTENPDEVDCKVEGISIVLKTMFLKK